MFSIFLKYYLPVLLWSGFIFLLSNQPNLPGPDTFAWDFVFKKSAHMFVYAVQYFLFFRAIGIHTRSQKQQVLWTTLFAVAFAVSDEFHQAFIPGRTGTLRDVGFDSLGMFVMWLKIHDYI